LIPSALICGEKKRGKGGEEEEKGDRVNSLWRRKPGCGVTPLPWKGLNGYGERKAVIADFCF